MSLYGAASVVSNSVYVVTLIASMDEIFRSQFRLPWSLYLQLKEAAGASGRSLNAELVVQLSAALAPGGGSHQIKAEPLNAAQLTHVLEHIALRDLLTAKEIDSVAKRLQSLLADDGPVS